MSARLLQRRAMALTVAALFGLALALRCRALEWGLPYVEHPDEPAVLETAVRMVQEGDANPGKFLYPSLHYYMLAAVVRAHAARGVARGLYASIGDLPAKTYLYTTAPELYVWGRALTAVLGALTVPLLYLLGRRMFDWRVGLLAALALALSAYHVQHSHFITTDVPTGVWVTLLLLGAWSVATTGHWRAYLLAGVATGLAAGTKYNAGVIGLAPGVAAALYVLAAWREGKRSNVWRLAAVHGGRLLAAGALALLVFLLTTPFAILDFTAFRRDMLINAQHYASGSHGDFIGRWRLDGYLAFFWRDGLTWPAALLLLAGLPLLAHRAPRQLAVLGVAVLAGGGLLLTQAVNFNRNTLPLFPPLFLLAAAATIALAEALGGLLGRGAGVSGPQVIDIRSDGAPSTAEAHRKRIGRRASAVIAVTLGGLLLIPHLLETHWLLNYWSKPHTLVAAAEALRAQPRGMLAAVEANPVQWAGDPAVTPVRWLGAYSLDWYRARGYRYLLVNSERYDLGDRPAYERLVRGAPAILEMPDRSLGVQPGPGGALLDLGEHVEMIPFTRRPARFGGLLDLLGYELAPGEPRSRITPLEGASAHAVPAGAPVQINLYWRALAPLDRDYTLFIHIYDAGGQRVAQRDLPLRYEDYPTSRWQPGELVIDRADMPLPALAPGPYRLLVGLYDAATGAPLLTESSAPVELTTLIIGS